MNEISDLKTSTSIPEPASNADKQSWLGDAAGSVVDAGRSALDTFNERPIESASGALVGVTLGVMSLRFKTPALEAVVASDSVPIAKSALRFGKFPELPGKFVIPTFRTEGGPLRETLRTVPELKVVSKDSTDARIFSFASPSTFKIVSTKSSGSGFLVDESGLIATANHVVANPDLPYYLRLNEGLLPARLMARDVANDVAILKVDWTRKGVRPLELNLDAYSKESGALGSATKNWDAGIALDREAYLIGFPNHAVQRVMTKGPVSEIGLFKNLSPEARLVDGEKVEAFKSAKVMHRVTSFGGYSGSPLLLENGLVVGIHTHGRYGGEFARAASVHHLSRLLDEVRLRPMVSGFGDYVTPVMVATSDTAKQIVRTFAPAQRANPVPTTFNVKIPPMSKPNA
ncbi:MAG: hypothetical protein C0469_13240 [Cyanobacteria bacterium DS2.3.42]|nr:hypothetical protein [Cyanobacteria bacterium DS2.3.42]